MGLRRRTGRGRPGARLLTVGVVVVLCAGLEASGSAGSGPAPLAEAASVSAGTLALDAGDWDTQPDAYRGGWVVMQPWEYDEIPRLRAENPDIKILMYQDVAATDSTSCRSDGDSDGECDEDLDHLPSGVGYWWAMDNRPDWFLRSEDGEPLEWADYANLYPMDIADPDYQTTWRDNVLRELGEHDWDGVMMDDTLTRLSHPVVGDATSTQIPDDDAMYAATASFLDTVGPAIKDAGYEVVPNVTVDADNWHTTMAEWTPYVSGWENEFLVKYQDEDERFGDEDWAWKLDLLDWTARHHVPMLAVTYGSADDTVTQTYHRATFLLAWNGRDGASMFVPEESGISFWLPHAVEDVGTPLADRTEAGSEEVWLRRYSEGVVVVNSGDEASSVPLGGRYVQDGELVDTVELAPRTAAILRLPSTLP